MEGSGAMQETVGEDIQVFIVNKIQEKNIHRNIQGWEKPALWAKTIDQ